jgi:hypothetical protein
MKGKQLVISFRFYGWHFKYVDLGFEQHLTLPFLHLVWTTLPF